MVWNCSLFVKLPWSYFRGILFAVPSFGPMGVEANATSSTTIVVKWGDVPREHQNGQIEGFKVYYGSNPRLPFQVCRFIFNVTISMWDLVLSLENKKETELPKYLLLLIGIYSQRG